MFSVIQKFSRWFMVMLLALTWPSMSLADQVHFRQIQSKYDHFISSSNSQNQKLPFILQSEHSNGVSSASVYTLIKTVDFATFSKQISVLSHWCKFIPIHLNVKACVTIRENGTTKLRFYLGRKYYMSPDQASWLELDFNTKAESGYLTIALNGDYGPYGSSDYHFKIQAIAVTEGVFLKFDLSNRPGVADKLLKLYFLTLGHNKIGFSTVGKSRNGKPKYVSGRQGAAERNIVRYILALQAYFDSLRLPAKQQFEYSINKWFDLTELYAKQLHELDRAEYLNSKRQERSNQFKLQHSIDTGEPIEFVSGLIPEEER